MDTNINTPMQPDDLLVKWHTRFRKSERAHYKSANSCRVFNYSLGIPLVIITTIIASEYFSVLEKTCRLTLSQQPVQHLNVSSYIVIALSLLAPVIAALQTFLRFPERAEQHRKAAINFGLLKKEIEKLLTFPPSDPAHIKEMITKIQEKDLQIMKEAPSIGAISLWFVNFKLKPESKKNLIKRLSDKKVEEKKI